MFLAFSWTNILSIFIFIILIAIIIAWHELGHLLTAKKCNVYCYEYSIGFGPVLFRNKKHETHFELRLIPLGGFVRMAGEDTGGENGEALLDNDGKEIPKERLLNNQSLPKRALILAAGGIMNIIMALLFFYFYVSFNDISGLVGKEKATGFAQIITSNEVNIGKDSYLATLGMERGDKVFQVQTRLITDGNDREYTTYETKNFNDIIEAINSGVPTNVGQYQDIIFSYYDVNDNNVAKEAKARRDAIKDENGNITVTILGIGQNYKAYEYNALTGLYGTFHFTGYYAIEVIKAFGKIFAGDISNLSGLVGIYKTVDTVASSTQVGFGVKFLNIIYIAGAISFSLGFFNLLPLPALDGGRLVFVIIEAIRKKKINPNVESMIHFIGIIVLFALMIFINIRDIINLFK